tara:strand:+ start:1952 stop:2503 length:552 start_codon:yes stop_codon:yes gene_type:complete
MKLQQLLPNTYFTMNKSYYRRFSRTITFLKKHIKADTKILDLGTPSILSNQIIDEGYKVTNTNGENLDIDYSSYLDTDAEVVTAFEIFEHMLAPFNILRELKTDKLVASIPMKLWFASAYWGSEDWDKHYHEFEKKQFDFLLKQSGWKIIDSETWISYDNKIGFRPILRRFIPRYYIVYCERI